MLPDRSGLKIRGTLTLLKKKTVKIKIRKFFKNAIKIK
jgi:hypothetical protein